MSDKVPGAGRAVQAAAVNATSSNEPEHARHGRARVSLLRGGRPEVTLEYGPDGFGFVDEQTARDLHRCLDELFGPLAATRRAARSAVALAGGVR